ncbi:MAG TPA: cation:proton antiporter [Bacteroidia bacterium]|nr:cation:proton antiporter [Bacteroidia bacterium]
MIHLADLITDLALILGAAAVVSLIFRKLKQPVVLGYIIAGLLVGPSFPILPTVIELKSINIWAEIGVIFLLFSLGLEFSFKKLARVGGSATITALVEVAFMLVAGYFSGKLMGWSTMDSIFLGGILSISSTTIIIRAFEETGIKHKKFIGLVFGVLIIEDLVAILLLVLLSTVAVTRQFGGMEMMGSVIKLGFFLVLWFLAGIFIIPTFLKRIRKLLSDEIMLIVSLALCLGMVLLATNVGFSPALGAFIMGSLLAETVHAERIEHLTKSVKDLFGAIFFVSVGMLIDPNVLVEYAGPIAIITVVTVVGKFISSGLGALVSGQSLQVSVQTGMSLSQIGEFSFIIASLGLSLNVTGEFLYPIAVAVSVLTTFTTPYLIKFSDSFSGRVARSLPEKLRQRLDRGAAKLPAHPADERWKRILESMVISTVVNSVIIITIVVLVYRYVTPWVRDDAWASTLTAIVTITIIAPFIWALAFRRFDKEGTTSIWFREIMGGQTTILQLVRISMAVFYIAILLVPLFRTPVAIAVALGFSAILMLFSKRIQQLYQRIEVRFLSNLNEREQNRVLAPWDAHLTEFMLPAESTCVGKTLQELQLREKFEINIAGIQRGHKNITVPHRNERLFPNDKLFVIGTDEQLRNFKLFLGTEMPEQNDLPLSQEVSLQYMIIDGDSPLQNQTVRESGIREKTDGLVVGVERKSERILNPESSFIFEFGDIIWIVGDPKKIQRFKENPFFEEED